MRRLTKRQGLQRENLMLSPQARYAVDTERIGRAKSVVARALRLAGTHTAIAVHAQGVSSRTESTIQGAMGTVAPGVAGGTGRTEQTGGSNALGQGGRCSCGTCLFPGYPPFWQLCVVVLGLICGILRWIVLLDACSIALVAPVSLPSSSLPYQSTQHSV